MVDGYWEYRLKPWDMAAGVIIAQEAGAKIMQMVCASHTASSRLGHPAALASRLHALRVHSEVDLSGTQIMFKMWVVAPPEKRSYSRGMYE